MTSYNFSISYIPSVVANMVGHPKHVEKAIKQGVDLIIAQGTEAGGKYNTKLFQCVPHVRAERPHRRDCYIRVNSTMC